MGLPKTQNFAVSASQTNEFRVVSDRLRVSCMADLSGQDSWFSRPKSLLGSSQVEVGLHVQVVQYL